MQLISHIKQRIFGFFLFFLYAFASNVIVFLVQLHPYKMPTFLNASNSSRTRTYEWVNYNIAFFLCLLKLVLGTN